jgi:hypothetical protein
MFWLKVQSETWSAATVEARHPNTYDNKMAAVACSNLRSLEKVVLDASNQASNAIATRGIKGALTVEGLDLLYGEPSFQPSGTVG